MNMIKVTMYQCPKCKYIAKEEKFIEIFGYETRALKCPKCGFVEDEMDWY